MLTFLRKHQRILFMVIAVITIASFLFFGTFGTMDTRAMPERKIGVAIDGSPITDQEVAKMVRFFSYISPRTIETDFLATGMATLLAERYFDEIKPDLTNRLEKVRKFRPYQHPEAPYISAEEVWKKYIPNLPLHLSELRKMEASPDSFACLSQLYLDESAFNPEYLRRFLIYQQRQYSHIQPDPRLSQREPLSLMNFHTMEDWFGTAFMNRLAIFLINGAHMAQEKGYNITIEETKADLNRTLIQSLSSKKPVTEEFLESQLRYSGLDMNSAIAVWKNVLLYRRLFDAVGQSVFVDPLSYQQMAAFAGESATVDLYQLPSHLRFTSFRSLLKFQYYLDNASPKARGSKLPTQFYSVQELEKRCPELVHTRAKLRVAKVKKEDLSGRISLRETWEWEASDAGWQLLQKEFPILGRSKAKTPDERTSAIDALELSQRTKVDQFARTCILSSHPEWLEAELQNAAAHEHEVSIHSRGAAHPFSEMEETKPLLEKLRTAALNETFTFTPDKDIYYRITLLEPLAEKQIMTFEEASQGDYLGRLLDKNLESAYSEIRRKEPSSFQLPGGNYKPFSEVKDIIGSRVFADFLSTITSEKVGLEYYSSHRLKSHMAEALKSIREEGEASSFLQATGDRLIDQWKLVKAATEIKRSEHRSISTDDLFATAIGAWSQVQTPITGDVCFFKLVNRGQAAEPIAENLDMGQKILSLDAHRYLMQQILDAMEKK
ncbi:MAG: hypothetical protein JSR58_04145 [Verrucomicrobia bacterium]|nr:hypothetical protein [Verrucomicrobiota bacterium]